MQLTLKMLLREGIHQLTESETAGLDARLLLQHATGLAREDLLREDERRAAGAEILAFRELIRRRQRLEPVAQIIGHKEFWGLDFAVTRDTLTPRPDSETLVSASLSLPYPGGAPQTVLDLGTGTGCLLIALLTECPACHGVALDISAGALAVARKNALAHDVGSRMALVRGSWLEAIRGRFDLVIGNPPYIAETDREKLSPDVKTYEPEGALFAGEDGLEDYRRIAAALREYLNPEGFAIFEIGQGQAKPVQEIFEAKGMRLYATHQDLAGIERCMIFKIA